MGSDSDLSIMEGAAKTLREFNVPYELMGLLGPPFTAKDRGICP